VKLFFLHLSYLLIFVFFVAVSYAGENINEIGKIFYSKENHSYYFVYLNNKYESIYHRLAVKSKSDRELLKHLENKSVKLIGSLDWIRGTTEHFILKEELTIKDVSLFELNVLAFDSHDLNKTEKLISHYHEQTHYKSTGGIPIPDAAANSLISAGAIAVGVAAGPVSLIPAAIFGIYQMFF
jgi:hypothetical protein